MDERRPTPIGKNGGNVRAWATGFAGEESPTAYGYVDALNNYKT